MARLADLITPQMLAQLTAQRSGMADAASLVGAGSPGAGRENAARALAANAAQSTGLDNAASMVGAGQSRGDMVRARRAELMDAGLSGVDAWRQMAAEGLVPQGMAHAMTAVPASVAK